MVKADSDESDEKTDSAPRQGGLKTLLLTGIVGLIAGGAGFAVPQFILRGASGHEGNASSGSEAGDKRESQNSNSAKRESGKRDSAKHDTAANQPAFVPFGEVVVNLADDRLSRYLRVNITLLVDGSNEDMVKKAVEKKKTLLKNWLIGYLSDKALDEVRGAVGVNRARREIQDHFNSLLFPEGTEIIREILFEDFTVT